MSLTREHLWDHLKRRVGVYDTGPGGILEMWERIEKEWEAIPASECQKLIESMPRRVEQVIKAKGGVYKVLDVVFLVSKMISNKRFPMHSLKKSIFILS